MNNSIILKKEHLKYHLEIADLYGCIILKKKYKINTTKLYSKLMEFKLYYYIIFIKIGLIKLV